MKNTGTLVGAPIRPNDSNDTYPSAVDNDIQGGRHSVATTIDRDAISAARRSAGMECYVAADGNTYELANDLVTWSLSKGSAGGTTNAGSGGNAADITLLSGNFGAWTPLSNLSGQVINQNYVLSYKTDLQAFPTRAITFLQGQFGLNGSFAGTTLLLGTLPANSRPTAQILKYFIVQNIEMFLQVDTNGNVSINSKDGFNLPTTSGTPETQPYYLDLFFNPLITTVAPTVYTYVRSATFVRNNCGTGYNGSGVVYNQTYTSTVDQATANSMGASDTNFNINGQAFANDPANGATCTIDTSSNLRVNNNSTSMLISQCSVGTLQTGNVQPGGTYSNNLPTGHTYSIIIKIGYGSGSRVGCNGVYQQSSNPAQSYTFTNVALPILVDLEDLSA